VDRVALSAEKYEQLFGSPPDPGAGPDPELMAILRHLIFGEVFQIGGLDDRTRELITVVVLVTNQTLPQLRSHVAAALNVGATPVEIREAVYQCAPFLGFPKTLNGVTVLNEVFAERGIALPLPDQATVDEHERLERGWALQQPLYGDEIRDDLAGLPDDLRGVVPRLLTEFCFGDFYTRSGLELASRELLVLCLLAALGGADVQLRAHAAGNLKAGNTVEVQIAAMIHCLPYIGFPRALNAIRSISQLAASDEGRSPPPRPPARPQSP
jgi:4-carboxymuconolactone decarboxylase